MNSTTPSTPVRTRMAPSPTGEMHVGSMATLLKNYAWARRNGGQFLLRIEDTDQEREVAGAQGRILDVIRAYGLDWDEGPDNGGPFGPYVQSQRLELYQQYAQQLVADDKAYHCFCSKDRLEQVREQQRANKQVPRYDRHCRSLGSAEVNQKLESGEASVIRLKVPDDQEVTFHDLVRGNITFKTSEVDDQVLLKSDGFPTYHLGVVVDDHLMNITHVIRGEEWISSTPKHILLYQAFGWEHPTYAHVPVYLNPNGKGKMSKRKGDVSAQSFLEKGYLPEAMLNFLMILGWTRADQEEIMPLSEYIAEFNPADINPKPVAFDMDKLNWINGVYIRKLSDEELLSRLSSFIPADCSSALAAKILPLIKERLVTLQDFETLSDFFYRPIQVDVTSLLKKADAVLVGNQLEVTANQLAELDKWTTAEIERVIRSIQEQNEWHKGQYFMMLRLSVTARQATPPLFETIEVLGKENSVNRLRNALA